MTAERNVVILGAGQAAAAFSSKLRELDPQSHITIVGDEPVLPYQRPPLSKKYMTGEMSLDRLLLRPQEWYDEHRITCRTGISATGISPSENTVALSDGSMLNYSHLLIATGATPRRIAAAAGGDLAGVYTLRSLADADAMAERFKPGKRLLIVGGGYIGLEAAAVAASLGLVVHVAEMAERILQRVASAATSDYFRDLHKSHGVTILEGASLTRLTGENGHVSGAEFADGTVLETDFVLVGIGVTANSELASSAGLAVGNGIEVDNQCRTSDPSILAAGDCTSFIHNGHRIRLESVQNAIEQAEAAAQTVVGIEVHYQPTPWFWSDQYDDKLQIAGLNTGYDRTVLRPGSREGAQSIWYFSGDRFLAVDAMNDSRAYMFGKKLLELKRPVTPEQAENPDFDLKTLIK
ncbi:MAG: FAD-dependent oxidoreductase [Nitratireductor sp.]|nr:FAD-dependent oxidoreductase [Nitratireductor sp.]MCB1456922.1 FAD-dependent oxidoreductase [Nitratireductor sp.]